MAKGGARSTSGKGAKVMFCHCTNKYQDEKYGKSMRLFTDGIKHQVCTVCGRTVNK